MAGLLWGIDLGGTKIEGAIIDPSDLAHPICRLRVETGAARGYDHILSQFSLLVRDLEEKSGLKRPGVIGVGTPGTSDPGTGLHKNANTTCLNGRTLKADLSAALGCEVRSANDANCCALAEATLGAARGHEVVFGVILGTGCGGGVVVGGKVLDGLHGIAGEWGHNPLRGEDAPCYCGRRGCVEGVLAGPSLERFYTAQSGQKLRVPEIVRRAAEGDPAALATLSRLREKFAEAIGAVINILDPHAIVIGGGVGNLDLLYAPETREAIAAHLFNDGCRTPILRPTLGDSTGVFGAAMLAA